MLTMLTTLQQAYILISLVLGATFLYRAVTNSSWQSVIHAIIVWWSGIIYYRFLPNSGSLGLPYYGDWIVTTPLIVIGLGYAINDKITRKTMIAMLSQFLTIFFAYLHVTTPSLEPFAMMASLTAFTTTIYILIQWLQQGNKPLLSWITLLTWFAYPAVYYAYDGMLGQATTALVILPLLSKHLFTALKEFYY